MSSVPKLEPKKPSSPRIVVKSQSTVSRGPAKTLSDVAREAGISLNVLRQLNPQLKGVRDTQTLSQAAQDAMKLPPKGVESTNNNNTTSGSPSDVSPVTTPPAIASSPKSLGGSTRLDETLSPGIASSDPMQRAASTVKGLTPPQALAPRSRSFSESTLGPARSPSTLQPKAPPNAASSPPRPERTTIRSIAIKHEFGVVDIVSVNPALANVGYDDPLPQGTKLSLPKRTQPKFSVVQNTCIENEASERDAILVEEEQLAQDLERHHDDVMLTIHMLHAATAARRDLLLADVIDDARFDFVGIEGGDTNDADYLGAHEDTRIMLDRMLQVATRADSAHWTALLLEPEPQLSSEPSVGQGQEAEREHLQQHVPENNASHVEPDESRIAETQSLSVSLAAVSGTPTNANVLAANPPISSLQGPPGFGAMPEEAAETPWGSVVKQLHAGVMDAIRLERRALLEANVTTLRSLIVRRKKLVATEKRIDDKFELLHRQTEVLRRREIAVVAGEQILAFKAEETEARHRLCADEMAALDTLLRGTFLTLLADVRASHNLRWNHQVRMAAAATTKKRPKKNEGPTAAADAALLSPHSAANAPHETADGVRFIIIAGDTPDPSPDGAAAVNAVSPARSDASSFQLDDAHDEDTATADPPTDSLATRNDVHRNNTPDDLGVATQDDHTDHPATRCTPTMDEGSEMSAFVSPQPTTPLQPTPQSSQRLETAVIPEQDADTPLGTSTREARDPLCLWDYLPAVVGATKSTFDEYDLRLHRDSATHIGFGANSRGRALLRVPLSASRHRIPGTTVVRFRYAPKATPADQITTSSSSLLRTPRAPQLSALPPVRPSPSKKRPAVPTPQPSIQLYAVVPVGGASSSDSSAARLTLAFDSTEDMLPEGATLAVVARVNIPPVGGEFELSVDLNARILMLREMDTGCVVARDGLWSAESVKSTHDQMCLGATITGLGSVITILQ